MICKNCGADIPDQAKFCPQCGTRRVGQESNVSAAEAESEAGKLYATVDPKRTSRATDSTSAPKAFQTRNANSEKRVSQQKRMQQPFFDGLCRRKTRQQLPTHLRNLNLRRTKQQVRRKKSNRLCPV